MRGDFDEDEIDGGTCEGCGMPLDDGEGCYTDDDVFLCRPCYVAVPLSPVHKRYAEEKGGKAMTHELRGVCESDGPRGDTICMLPLGHGGPCGWERLDATDAAQVAALRHDAEVMALGRQQAVEAIRAEVEKLPRYAAVDRFWPPEYVRLQDVRDLLPPRDEGAK